MKKELLLLFLIVQFTSGFLAAQSQGPRDPDTANYSAFGCLACPGGEWQNLPNITHQDHLYVDVSLATYPMCFQTSCYYSRTLHAFDFGFTIPNGATILGVTVGIIRKAGQANGVSDSLVSLYVGNPVGSNHASPFFWPVNPALATYGDSVDTWGWMLSPDTVNSTQFGVALIIMNKSFNGSILTASVDNINMTVYYSTNTGIASQTKSANAFSVRYDKESALLSLRLLGTATNGNVRVIDMLGNQIYSGELQISQNGKMDIELPGLRQGIYFAVMNSNGKSSARRFTVE